MSSKTKSLSSSGKRIRLLFWFSFLGLHIAFGQGGTWTWISGDSAANSPGVYGTQGIPSIYNHPPANYEMVEWKDKQGNFWVYGGSSYGYSDLWKFNPVTLEWVKGNGQLNVTAVYGVKGVASPTNTPATRGFAAITWVDTSDIFWLFGGNGTTNDLWSYDTGTNQWTWVNGNQSFNGKHGTLGVASPLNVPGARDEGCSGWTDSLNNLWLFGGNGYDDNGVTGTLDDVMQYSISSNEWTWIKGSAFVNVAAVYGTKGVPNSSNDPGSRWSYTKWKDKQGNFWLFGGGTFLHSLEDMWKYDPAANQWTWMNGSSILNDAGKYGSKCFFDSSKNPAARIEQRASITDNCGRFWLFGGTDGYYNYNDLWLYDPQQLQWKLLSGDSITNLTGNYGVLGAPSITNVPPSRRGADAWWGSDNKFYMFGGLDINTGFNFSDVWVFNPDTTCVPICNSTSALPPVASFTTNDMALCENDCINFTDLSTNATSWLWIFPSGTPSSSTDQNPQVCYLTAGVYNVTLVASNSGGSDTLSINNYISVNAAPATPTITQVHSDTLFCSTNAGYIHYQWYLDSAIVPNTTDTFLVISKSGNYNVEVTGANGCKIGVGINVVIGLQNWMSDHVVLLSPNPAGDKFTVYGLRFTVSKVEIYNTLGQKTSPPAFTTANPSSGGPLLEERGEASIDVSGLSAGIYFVQLIGEKSAIGRTRPGEERWVGRFVKE